MKTDFLWYIIIAILICGIFFIASLLDLYDVFLFLLYAMLFLLAGYVYLGFLKPKRK